MGEPSLRHPTAKHANPFQSLMKPREPDPEGFQIVVSTLENIPMDVLEAEIHYNHKTLQLESTLITCLQVSLSKPQAQWIDISLTSITFHDTLCCQSNVFARPNYPHYWQSSKYSRSTHCNLITFLHNHFRETTLAKNLCQRT